MEDEAPDWLAGLSEEAPEEAPASPAEAGLEEAEVPEWVHDLVPPESEIGEEPSPPDEEVFGWTAFGESTIASEIAREKEEKPPSEAPAEPVEAPPEETLDEEMPIEEIIRAMLEESEEDIGVEDIPASISEETLIEQISSVEEGAKEEEKVEGELSEEILSEEAAPKAKAPVAEPLQEPTPSGDEVVREEEPVIDKVDKEEEIVAEAPAKAEIPEEKPGLDEKRETPVEEPTPPEPEETVLPSEPVTEEPIVEAAEEEAAAAAAAVPEEEILVEKPKVEKPEKEEAPIEEPVTAEAEMPSVEILESIETQRVYLDEHPRDYKAWLELARRLWQVEEREEAVEAYNQVIEGGTLLENVISDLEQEVEQFPDADLQQALGDAYMKEGRVEDALQTYRQALETL